VTPTPDLCDRYGDRVYVAEPLFRDFGGLAEFTGEIETVRVLEDN
jgi:regulator of ribonuclease activity A